jgi:hypothetical protein
MELIQIIDTTNLETFVDEYRNEGFQAYYFDRIERKLTNVTDLSEHITAIYGVINQLIYAKLPLGFYAAFK